MDRLARTAGLWAFNLWFFALFLAFSALWIPSLSILVALWHLATRSRRSSLRRFRRAISWYGRVIIGVLPWPFIRTQFVDHEPDAPDDGYVFVCNHPASSYPFLMAFLPFECVQVAKAWPLRLPVLGRYARWAGYLSIAEMPIEEFLARGRALLKAGTSVIVFPEGTRSGRGPVGQFHGAAIRLAIEARAPIVPVCIVGNEDMPPRGSLLLRTGRVTVTKLPRIEPGTYADMTPFEVKNLVRAQLIETRDQLL